MKEVQRVLLNLMRLIVKYNVCISKRSEGKTNKYDMMSKGGNLQIQVYNKGGSKPFELNMYKRRMR